ncbi:MAG: flavodoxin family protein, partial [Pseudobutyrivibrio sp.]|nr:flavodoxin family protein [Pseudobutyrivibrio sp.]
MISLLLSSSSLVIKLDDLVNEAAKKFEEADGLLVGSPVYYGSPNGTLLSFLDRL